MFVDKYTFYIELDFKVKMYVLIRTGAVDKNVTDPNPFFRFNFVKYIFLNVRLRFGLVNLWGEGIFSLKYVLIKFNLPNLNLSCICNIEIFKTNF